MTYKWYISLIAAIWIATAVAAFTAQPWFVTAVASGVGLLLTGMLYRAVHKPLNAVNNGIYLLREQDFSSKLTLTGQYDADKVVNLFNRLMDAMKTERLKQQEQTRLLGLLIEASPMGIAICDFDNKIINRNKSYLKLVNESLETQLMAMSDDEVRTIRTDDTQVCRCSKLWFMDSGFRRRFFLVEIMTEEILKAEKRMFNKIVRTLGHEVNNSMGSVVSVIDSLKQMHNTDKDLTAVLDSTITSCLNLAEFVSSYSGLVKLPAPVPEPTDLNALMSQMLPSLRRLAPSNIEIMVHPCDNPGITNLDAMLIQRVMTNVVKNSVESIGDTPQGQIEIRVLPHRVEITDNGGGIAPEIAEQIFTPFFSTKRTDRGLGLMLVSEILRAHGATFSLATDPVSGLTTFSIAFKRDKT